MADIKKTVATNLLNLRKANHLTQVELGEKLSYSDKAISKWEQGDTLPDIEVLCTLASLYNVTLDYLTQDHTDDKIIQQKEKRRVQSNKIVIVLLGIIAIFMVATILYVNFKIVFNINSWMLFLWAVPVTCVLLIIFNAIWGKRAFTFILITVLCWTTITCFYIEFIEFDLWALFLLGAPTQLAIILWSNLKRRKKK